MKTLENLKSHSGLRGIYGEQITPQLAYLLTQAYISTFNVKEIIIGRDTRPSGLPLKYAAISAATAGGVNVTDVDIAPTPAILYSIKKLQMDGGLIISASHNPPEYNAIKIAGKGGLLIERKTLNEVLKKFGEERITNRVGRIGHRDIVEMYFYGLIENVDFEMLSKSNFKVVVDPGGGAGSITTPKLLTKMNCKVISINAIPGIYTRRIEPTVESLKQLSETVKAVGADIGFAHDCDADRLVCVDDKGRILGYNYSMALAVWHILSRRKVRSMVINAASSRIFEYLAEKFHTKIYVSKIGEANVVRKMIETDSPLGVEGSSGGLIWKDFHLARDGALAALMILEGLAVSGRKPSEILDEMPKYHMEKVNIECSRNEAEKLIKEKLKYLAGLGELDFTDGIKISADNWWIMIRPSKTEPKIRIIVEAVKKEKAKKLMKTCLNLFKTKN